MMEIDGGGAVYVAEGGGGDDGQGLVSDKYNMPSAQFEKTFAQFLLHFKLNGETVYKEQIRRVRTALGAEHGVDQSGASSGAARLSGLGAASIRLDIEHLAKWRTSQSQLSLDGGGGAVDFDAMSQAMSDTSEHSGGVHWGEAMMQALRRHPLKYLPNAENAIKKIYAALAAEEHTGGGPAASGAGAASIGSASASLGLASAVDMHTLPNIQLEVLSRDKPTKIRDLKALDVESLVVIPGIVLQAGKPQHKATVLRVQCKDCKTEKFVRIPPWRQSVCLPRTCDTNKQGGERCSLDPFIVLSDESQYTDVQSIKIQELAEDVPTGDMPRHLVINCASAMCGRVIPGERVFVVGVFSSFERSSDRSSEGVRSPYIHALGMDYYESTGQRKMASWGFRLEQEFRQMAQDPDIVNKITKSIAPAIFGSDDVKRSVACLLFGGSRKKLPDNTKIRGDINVLLLGDPSTAKSQILKFVDKCAPIAVFTSGKGSSAAGLTAAIVRDASGNFALEGGAMVLADGGVVCIDEFDKMRDDDRVAIHEAMEQQTISIAKAGITTILNTKCAVLAAANPSFGSYDDSKDTTEQHDFETTILSRFDMIWVIRDDRSADKDKVIARHVFALHAGASDPNAFEGPIPMDRLRQYISYCRAVCDPRLSESAAKKLENYYVEVRQVCRADKRRKRDQIPITVRQLESLARLSESLAKMSLSPEVDTVHVDEAIRLFHLATIEASKSSLARENLTSEERQMVKSAEDAILQRLPLHARASKATIVRDLRMRGFDASFVSRAIRILIQKGLLEERGDASVRRVPSGDP